MCKQKVVPSQGDSDSESDEVDSGHEEEGVSESTPLLHSRTAPGGPSFGAAAASQSQPAPDQESSNDASENCNSEKEGGGEAVAVETVVVQLQENHLENSAPHA